MERQGDILIIDDDARNIFALAATLKTKGYSYASCYEAKEALELLKTPAEISLVLMDMMMPDLDGYDTIPLIRRIPGREQLPILAVTAQAMKGDREKCLAAGAADYLAKPIDVDRLMELIRVYVKK
jgi:CheY-like chemotaxis protein